MTHLQALHVAQARNLQRTTRLTLPEKCPKCRRGIIFRACRRAVAFECSFCGALYSPKMIREASKTPT